MVGSRASVHECDSRSGIACELEVFARRILFRSKSLKISWSPLYSAYVSASVTGCFGRWRTASKSFDNCAWCGDCLHGVGGARAAAHAQRGA